MPAAAAGCVLDEPAATAGGRPSGLPAGGAIGDEAPVGLEDGAGRIGTLVELVGRGALRLVERFNISLPLTTRLSLDLRKSRVSISARDIRTCTTTTTMSARTIAASVKVDDAADAEIDDSQKALILFLELFLIEYLDGEDALIVCLAARVSV